MTDIDKLFEGRGISVDERYEDFGQRNAVVFDMDDIRHLLKGKRIVDDQDCLSLSNALDHVDLMKDEILRINALCAQGVHISEIQQICERALTVVEQKVPVLDQRDRAVSMLDSIRAVIGK